MGKDYKTENAFSSFNRNMGKPHAFKKNEDAIKAILKEHRVENLDREPEYKREAILKKIAGITNFGYDARKAVLGYGKKEPEQVKPKEEKPKTGSMAMNRGNAGSVRLIGGKSPVQDFSVSNKHLRNNNLISPAQNNTEIDNVREKIRNIQS